MERFLGINYASVPERFGLSVINDQPWTGTRNATTFGPLCIQDEREVYAGLAGGVGSLPAELDFAEECLYLNVYRPANTSITSLFPVLFYIPGGGFTLGGGSLYDGSVLAQSNQAIVVTTSYRLGYLGCLCPMPQPNHIWSSR